MDRKKMRVLVVDDSPSMRRVTVERLGELGFEMVEMADNGRKGLECLTGRKKYHLVCTDWNMPEMNGIEMIEAIRGNAKIGELPIIMLTSHSTDRDVAQALQAGVSDYLIKPFRPDILGVKIEKVLSSGRARMSEIYKTENSAALVKMVKTARDSLSQEEIDTLLSASEGESQPMTQEEINARLEAAGVSTAAPVSHTAPDGRIITGYDFKHPARVNKDQLRTLENLHDNFARLLSSTFSGAMRAVVDVDTAFVDQTTYAEFIMSLSNPSCSYQMSLTNPALDRYTVGPTYGQIIIDVAMPIVFAGVDRIFGGKGSAQGVEPRQITQIEIGVINRIAKRMIEDLEATWSPILPVEITDIELETNPEFMQITAASEIVILLAFEVNSTNASGLISLCYPFFTLESILPRLGQQSNMRTSGMDQDEVRNQKEDRANRIKRQRLGYVSRVGKTEERILANRLRLGEMEVEMVAELGRTKVALEEAQNLGAGDVVRLPTRVTDPATVYLGGKPKFLARPFADKRGELKLKVTDRVPDDLLRQFGTVATGGVAEGGDEIIRLEDEDGEIIRLEDEDGA
jgi:flagellar motor switch protein FliM